MVPLLVSALVGIGVKIATDLFMSGAKKVMKPDAPGSSFANTLDTARSVGATGSAAGAAAGPMTASAGTIATDAGLGDRSKVMASAVIGGAAAPPAGHAYGVATYRRFDEVQAP